MDCVDEGVTDGTNEVSLSVLPCDVHDEVVPKDTRVVECSVLDGSCVVSSKYCNGINSPDGLSDSTASVDPFSARLNTLNNDSVVDVEAVPKSQESNDLSPTTSASSPILSARLPVTENDPLGLFNPSSTSVSTSHGSNAGSKTTSDGGSTPGAENHVTTSCSSGNLGYISSSGTSSPGSPVVIVPWATPVHMVTANVQAKVQKETVSDEAESAASKRLSREADSIDPKPPAVVTRSEVLGSVVRSAATRFASKYREIKQSMGTPVRNGSVSSGSLTSINSLEQQQAAVAPNEPPTSVSPHTEDNVRRLSSSKDTTTQRRSSTTTQDEVTGDTAELIAKSRLKVPGLYAPFGEFFHFCFRLDHVACLHGLNLLKVIFFNVNFL